MVCLGLEPGAAGWKVQTNPLSYGSTPTVTYLVRKTIAVWLRWSLRNKKIGCICT